MTELTQLTLEAHNELARAGKVEQISEPLTFPTAYGMTGKDLMRAVEFCHRDYPAANAYMGGLSRVNGNGDFVTPLVFYKVSQ